MLRAIREIQPRWVVGENVFGLINWSDGLVFHEVQADLEAAGYEVFPYVLPAAAVNAPHRRDRIWFVAHAKGNRNRRKLSGLESQDGCKREPEKYWENNLQHWNDGGQRNATDTKISSSEGELQQRQGEGKPGRYNSKKSILTHAISSRRGKNERRGNGKPNEYNKISSPGSWENFPTKSPICGGDDGLPTELDGITFSKWRNESIKAAGNAIVPQVALQIFKAIEEFATTLQK